MSRSTPSCLLLPAPLQRRVEAAVARWYEPEGRMREDFAHPFGEPALMSPDSVSWRVLKNPVVLFIGGVAAVILELAEPRVRSGVWEHTRFRDEPVERMRRTALATVVTVYGARSRAQAMIEQVNRLHGRIAGTTPHGQAYRATDPELLTWVHATASFGFLQAHQAHVAPLADTQRDAFYAEALPAAQLWGATGAPGSQAALELLFERMRDRLEPSDIVLEFLHIVARMPALPRPLRPMQRLLVNAAVQITPPWVRDRLGLGTDWALAPWQRRLVDISAHTADRLLLRSGAAVQACRRLNLPDDYLHAPPPATGF